MDLTEALQERRSCRAFRPDPVPREEIEAVLADAARAPSAVNLQAWRVWVCTGAELERLRRDLVARYRERQVGCSPGGGQRPRLDPVSGPGSFGGLAEILRARGEDLGTFINEGSCRLYGAPAGVFCFLEAGSPPARRLDCGIWLAYLLLSAHARGLGTCPVGLLLAYEDVVREHLFVPGGLELAAAVALGRPDPDDPVNAFRSPRRGLGEVEWVE